MKLLYSLFSLLLGVAFLCEMSGCTEQEGSASIAFSVTKITLNGTPIVQDSIQDVPFTNKIGLSFSEAINTQEILQTIQFFSRVGGLSLPFSVEQVSEKEVILVLPMLQRGMQYQLLIPKTLLNQTKRKRLERTRIINFQTLSKSGETKLVLIYKKDTIFSQVNTKLIVPLIPQEDINAVSVGFVLPQGARLYDVQTQKNVLEGSGTLTNINLSLPKKYWVVAEDEIAITEYIVTGIFGQSNTKEILKFRFTTNLNSQLRYDMNGLISGNVITITLPSRINLSTLVPFIDYEAQSIYPPQNMIQDFNKPVSYTLTAENNTVRTYTVIVQQLQEKTYTVTFDPQNGENFTSKVFGMNTVASAPIPPKRLGYVFDGWYLYPNDIQSIDFTTPFNENVTLYAKWKKICAVNFDMQGGTPQINPQLVITGRFLLYPPTLPPKDGFQFAGWYTNPNFTGNPFDFQSTPITGDTLLYAKWNESLGFVKSFIFEKSRNPNLSLGDNQTDVVAVIDEKNATIVADFSAYQYATLLIPTITVEAGTSIRIDPSAEPSNSTSLNFINFSAPVIYTFQKGNGTLKSYKVVVRKNPYAEIPDINFLNSLKKIPSLSFKGDLLEIASALNVQYLDITNPYSERTRILSLEGIEFFTNLLTLKCDFNTLTSLNLSKNKSLTYLSCNDNSINTLDLKENLALSYLDCSYNTLGNLDISQNENLKTLICNNNQLSALIFHPNSSLIDVNCMHNFIGSLVINNRTQIHTLICNNNLLSILDMSSSPQLELLNFEYNQVTNVNLSQSTKLKQLYCQHNLLDTMDLSSQVVLDELFCSYNQLKTLDITPCLQMTSLRCNDNPDFTLLDMRKNTNLQSLVMYKFGGTNNRLKYIYISQNQKCNPTLIQSFRDRYFYFNYDYTQRYATYDDQGILVSDQNAFEYYNECQGQ